MGFLVDDIKNGKIGENQILLKRLGRGIDDMEKERELPLEEAFQQITELRNIRRNARA